MRVNNMTSECRHYLKGLIQVSDGVCFDISVLLSRTDQLWESRKQPFYPDATHIHKLSGYQGCKKTKIKETFDQHHRATEAAREADYGCQLLLYLSLLS